MPRAVLDCFEIVILTLTLVCSGFEMRVSRIIYRAFRSNNEKNNGFRSNRPRYALRPPLLIICQLLRHVQNSSRDPNIPASFC